ARPSTTPGSVARLAAPCAGRIPITAVTARLSPRATMTAAARAAATSSTQSGSTAGASKCAAPPAAIPTAPGPRSADRRWSALPAGPGVLVSLPACCNRQSPGPIFSKMGPGLFAYSPLPEQPDVPARADGGRGARLYGPRRHRGAGPGPGHPFASAVYVELLRT